MRATDPMLYLVGHAGAIRRIAADRTVLLLGAFLVLSASLARNYDGAYLGRESHVLAHGLVVSVANAALIFFLLYAVARARKVPAPPAWGGFLSFLGLFWMTSPMAWLYAVPFERFMAPVDAVEANLWTLAGVALWRVLLISRALSVLYNVGWWRVLCLVLCVADVLILVAAATMPGPVVDLMGGLQHAPEHALLSAVRFATMFWSVLLAFPLLVAALVAGHGLRGGWAPDAIVRARVLGPTLVGFAGLLAWIPALAATQTEQANRWRVDSLMKARMVAEGLAELSRHERADYPPMWDPPPRSGYADAGPSWREIASALVAAKGEELRPWVIEHYAEKKALEAAFREHGIARWRQMDGPLLRDQVQWLIREGDRETVATLVEMSTGLEPDLRTRALRALGAPADEPRPSE